MFHPRALAGLALALTLPSLVFAAPLAEDEIDLALVAEEICPLAILDLTLEAPKQLGVTLYSPCHAGQTVVLDHGGLVLTTAVSEIGAVYASLPMVAPDAPVTVTFENGMMADALPPGAPLENLQQVSARY